MALTTPYLELRHVGEGALQRVPHQPLGLDQQNRDHVTSQPVLAVGHHPVVWLNPTSIRRIVMGYLVSGCLITRSVGCALVSAVSSPALSEVTRTFGERVRSRRVHLGMTQDELAQASGLHWTYVGQIERGRRNLTLHNIVKLAAGLGVDPGRLVEGLSRAP